MLRRWNTRFLFAAGLLVALLTLGACGGDDDDDTATTTGSTADASASTGPAVKLRLGYFPNMTHAQPIVGLATGIFDKELGERVTLETKTFNAGPSVIDALFAGEIDASYIGPNPTINGYVKSNGEALRIIAGAASGGAALVVRPASGIEKAGDLAGKTIATPQLGNTQDVALRAYVDSNGLKTKEKGGNVTILPTANPDTFTLFERGRIDGAWVPEPWATRLVLQAGGKLFLDERTLWPNGDFVTTHLIVRTEFLKKHPEAVERLLRAHVKATQYIEQNPDKAKELTNQGIKELTGAGLAPEVIDAAWQNIRFTYDPIASSLRKSALEAFELGFLGSKNPDLKDIYALQHLNAVLKGFGLGEVAQ